MTNRERLFGLLCEGHEGELDQVVEFLIDEILTNKQVSNLVKEIKADKAE